MKKPFVLAAVLLAQLGISQTNPIITKWLRNTTGITGRHYVAGNSTPINDAVLANVQNVQYSTNWVYMSTNGIPSYITGPFLDGNPSLASAQNAIFKLPLIPQQNTGTLSPTTGGNIGQFINGVALFDYRDGVAWNSTSNSLCGPLPGMSQCPGGPGTTQAWNRDAVLAEKGGFDCAKAHPANGNYHHHQNPSAFNLDLVVISTVCNLYPADGLYVINTNEHSPLLGFAADGFPIYGAYAYANTDGTGGISRMKSSYQLRNMTTRTTSPTGATVASGPAVSTQYPLGYFKEDYEFVAHPSDPTYLDVHNGRFCITPDYPNGIYAYFTTVDANHNSAYPYAVGPTFYGVKSATKVTSITEPTTTYNPALASTEFDLQEKDILVYPNPASDFIAVQLGQLVPKNQSVELIDTLGRVIASTQVIQGSTMSYFDTSSLYNGIYFVRVAMGKEPITVKVIISK
ncbi:MAG: hypothetical protein RLZ77_1452 [Bacteroidota bacterium]|jgi:hypothetical protein